MKAIYLTVKFIIFTILLFLFMPFAAITYFDWFFPRLIAAIVFIPNSYFLISVLYGVFYMDDKEEDTQ
jgi:hypothetical protein